MQSQVFLGDTVYNISRLEIISIGKYGYY